MINHNHTVIYDRLDHDSPVDVWMDVRPNISTRRHRQQWLGKTIQKFVGPRFGRPRISDSRVGYFFGVIRFAAQKFRVVSSQHKTM